MASVCRAVSLSFAIVLCASAARAEEEPLGRPLDLQGNPVASPSAATIARDRPKVFEPAWQPEADYPDFLITGAATSIAVAAAVTRPRSDHITDHNAFDEHVRDALRLPRIDDRYEIRDASDVGISLLVTWPFLVDGLVTAYYMRGNFELAKKMAIVSAEVLAVNAATQGVTNTIASRERPFGRDCGKSLPQESVDCDGSVRYRSFFSGHASNAFAAAATICIWHMKLGLLGSPGDVLSCAGAYGVAAATATFRVMGDMHYASDVLTGAAVGTLFGVGIPLMHGKTATSDAASVRVRLVPVGTGIGLGGSF